MTTKFYNLKQFAVRKKLVVLSVLFILAFALIGSFTYFQSPQITKAADYYSNCGYDAWVDPWSYDQTCYSSETPCQESYYPSNYPVDTNSCNYEANYQPQCPANTQNLGEVCANTYYLDCTYFYEATWDGNYCSTGGDTSFDKDDIYLIGDYQCGPDENFKFYLYGRQQGGYDGRGPIICADYEDRDREDLRWLPQVYQNIYPIWELRH